MESSRGFRAEGMTTLSRKLDASPKSRCLGGFYFLSLAEIQYWTYSPVVFCFPTTSKAVFCLIIRISEYGFWFSSSRFGGILFISVAPERMSVNLKTSRVDSYDIEACPDVSLIDLNLTWMKAFRAWFQICLSGCSEIQRA